MRILFVGDVMGRGGRQIVAGRLPELRDRLKLDFVVVNGENASHGKGITPAQANQMYAAGADVITLGNHAFDNDSVLSYFEREPRLLRPINIARGAPGRGSDVFSLPDGRRVLVLQLLGRVGMPGHYDDPFEDADRLLAVMRIGREVNATVLDFHAEATSETMAMGWFCDGRVSMVVGTHTHVPTADTRILEQGTAYVTDVGMCGSFNSVIGNSKEAAVLRFSTGMRGGRLHPAVENPTLCAIYVETDDRMGLARRVEQVRVGGALEEIWPEGIE